MSVLVDEHGILLFGYRVENVCKGETLRTLSIREVPDSPGAWARKTADMSASTFVRGTDTALGQCCKLSALNSGRTAARTCSAFERTAMTERLKFRGTCTRKVNANTDCNRPYKEMYLYPAFSIALFSSLSGGDLRASRVVSIHRPSLHQSPRSLES